LEFAAGAVQAGEKADSRAAYYPNKRQSRKGISRRTVVENDYGCESQADPRFRGRIVQSMQVDASEVSIGFFDGSIMQIKIMESNSPPLREQAHIRTISEDKVKILIECEDESTFDVTLAEPGNSLSVRNKNNQIEYLG
jgi:hypothetical protein